MITVTFGRVAHKAGQMGLFGFHEDASSAISPEDQVDLRGRRWRFSQPQRMGGYLLGKLGYVRQAELMQTYYDEDARDFIEAPAPASQVQYSRWALDLESQMLVFERKPRVLETQAFVAAFRALLSLHPDRNLTVELVAEPSSFYEWQGSVDRIVHFRAVLRPPNPHWSGRTDQLKEIVDKPNASEVTLDLKSASEDGLRVQGTVLDEVVQFQGEGYASVRAEGQSGDHTSRYDSGRKVATDTVEIENPADHRSMFSSMIQALRARIRRS